MRVNKAREFTSQTHLVLDLKRFPTGFDPGVSYEKVQYKEPADPLSSALTRISVLLQCTTRLELVSFTPNK
jgi:hypothetical protein